MAVEGSDVVTLDKASTLALVTSAMSQGGVTFDFLDLPHTVGLLSHCQFAATLRGIRILTCDKRFVVLESILVLMRCDSFVTMLAARIVIGVSIFYGVF